MYACACMHVHAGVRVRRCPRAHAPTAESEPEPEPEPETGGRAVDPNFVRQLLTLASRGTLRTVTGPSIREEYLTFR